MNALPGACTGPALHYSERYIELLACGGSVLLLSRMLRHGCNNGGERGWGAVTMVRRQLDNGSWSRARALLDTCVNSTGLTLSFNGAFMCVREGLLVAMGAGPKPRPGVVKHTVGYQIDPMDGTAHGTAVGEPSQVLLADWRASNCFQTSRGRSAGPCRFDSKPTLVAWQGSLYLFVRANINMPGGRHVQVTKRKGTDPLAAGEWPALKMVRLRGYETKSSNNIYFFAVTAAVAIAAAHEPGTSAGVHVATTISKPAF